MRLKIILIFTGLFIISASIVAYFYYQVRTAQGLTLDFTVEEQQVRTGVPFDLKLTITNSSNNVLQETMLTVSLPEDMVFIATVPDKTIENKTIGSLGSGSITEETFRVVALSGGQSIKRIEAKVSYLPTSLGSRFEQSKTVDVNITEAGIKLDLEAPQKVFSGEEFDLIIRYSNVSDIDFNDLRLVATYPSAFHFVSATLDPDRPTKDSWDFGGLRSGSEGELTIRGRLTGPDSAFYDMKLGLTSEFFGGTYVIGETSATISIAPSPLSLVIAVNENPDYVARPLDHLLYTISYTNNTDVALKDVIISAKLSGSMFDLSQISTAGFLRSTDATIIWNASRVGELVSIPPGASGSVSFSARVRKDYPITRVGDRNFTLKVSASIESPTVPYFVSADKTLGQVELITKIAGSLSASAPAYFRDAASGIINQGPLPPKVGQTTQFTIHWRLINTSTDMEKIKLTAFLGPNVQFTGIAKSNVSSVPTYNARTQELVWEIDRIAATQGTLTDPIEAIVQVSLTPSIDQKGKFAVLMTKTSVRATDVFTGASFSTTVEPVTTELRADATVGQKGVVE